jgi:hypothetical protein
MRKITVIATIFAGLSLSVSGAEAAPWCAQYSGGGMGGATNCGFYSFDQCLQTVRGIGGFCSLNPFEAYGYQQPRQQRPARRSWGRE